MKHLILMIFTLILSVNHALAYGSTELESNVEKGESENVSYNYYICMAEMKSKNLGDVSGLCATLYSQNQNQSVNPRNLAIQLRSCFTGQLNQGLSRLVAAKACTDQLKKTYENDSNSQTVERQDNRQSTEVSI